MRLALMALTVVVVVASWYVGSYAPMLWLIYRCPAKTPVSSDVLDAYRPVEWLIDATPVSDPLYVWARWWGVADIQIRQECARKGIWILMD